ncbi:MAG: glycosyltransferase [Leptolyngbyaceae cyanobacterium SM1_4_3]|nr:glycosyltransferase [Leptolyngbyaceae cyanobacterium SM1_4_3]NJN04396.1 glycosyltransferase [Leptolyngbyaceae cyanobacterium RM1_1_2]
MKIVQISTWKTSCGIAGYTKGLVEGFLKENIHCEVLPIDVKKLKYMTRYEIKEHFQELALKASIYDIIHVQHEFSFFSGAYGTKESLEMFAVFLHSLCSSGKKVFVTFHTEPFLIESSRLGIKQFLKKTVLQLYWKQKIASMFNSKKNLSAIVHTKNSRRVFIDSGLKSSKIFLVKQGVTISHPDNAAQMQFEEKAIIKQELGFSKTSVILSMFGFISEYKGYLTALRALLSLPDHYCLIIVGKPHPEASDKTLNEVLRFVQKHKDVLSSRVHLTGYLPFEKLLRYYSIVDFCLAPYKGGTKLSSSAAITWALASGKPVVASRISSFQELFEESDCLCLISPDSPYELAYVVQKLYQDDLTREQLVKKALEYCQKNQWANVAANYLKLYEQLSY